MVDVVGQAIECRWLDLEVQALTPYPGLLITVGTCLKAGRHGPGHLGAAGDEN